ncbi:Uncharacterized protein Adt_26570 [Abeliophyllum distichum]|uniref:Integrase catalytic domain-containing protein n=1 Tax=Abeliophyllum distichum TaxID=126358 RepID=A0ABD1RT44_9LAMI
MEVHLEKHRMSVWDILFHCVRQWYAVHQERVELNCEELGIRRYFSTPYYSQFNGQVEAVNKIIKYTLKKKLKFVKGGWAEELHETLWSYRTTSQTETGKISFVMTFGTEAMILVEMGILSK